MSSLQGHWEVEMVLIEDDANDARFITRVLEKHDLAQRIVGLQDGAEAVAFFAAPDAPIPKVILLDLKLPKLTGIEVLRALKADDRTRTVPVVALTSSQEERDVREAYDLGVSSFITKPIRFDEFTETVADLGKYWLRLNKPNV